MTENATRCEVCDGLGADRTHDLHAPVDAVASSCSAEGGLQLHLHCHEAIHELLAREPHLQRMEDRPMATRIGIVRLRAHIRHALDDLVGGDR